YRSDRAGHPARKTPRTRHVMPPKGSRSPLYRSLSASRRMPTLIAMRDRMRAKGKASKTILIAVARQLLVILNAMIQKRQPLQVT
ncbi:hypothetical protein AD940_00035, partial [Gluconobacter thailandicus]